MNKKYFFLIVLFFGFMALWAQEKKAGPIILDYGKVWKVENQNYEIDENKQLKVVFDIINSPEDPSALNSSIETAARFLNMHAQNGVAKENMKVALVIHNKVSKDIITNTAYQKRYGLANPNKAMVKQQCTLMFSLYFVDNHHYQGIF